MSLLGWFKRFGRTLDSRAEPTDAAVGGLTAPTSVIADTSAQIREEAALETELEEGR
jgi:hypothetical protein